MFIKLGENLSFDVSKNILTPKQALSDEKIIKRFIKLAKKLKRIAPRAEDFLYGHAVMMHAAEAALIDQNTGEPILNKNGKPVRGYFENLKNSKNQDSVKWVSPDNIMPYKNANGDIFGEETLIKAHKKWVGVPLCKDHKSESVDGIRGIVIDTYYDPKFKRIHALFALDKKNYGDLARKVETGYANCVSMGTGVGRSICTECHNVAFTEKDYCKCIIGRNNYGEINLDLSPIELSLVVNGADSLAKIRQIVANINNYATKKQARINKLVADRCVNPTELQSLSDSVCEIQAKLNSLMQIEKAADLDVSEVVGLTKSIREETDPETKKLLEDILEKIKAKEMDEKEDNVEPTLEDEEAPEATRSTMGGGSEYTSPEWTGSATEIGINPTNRLASRKSKKKEEGKQGAFSNEIRLLRSKINEMNNSLIELKLIYSEDKHMNSARLKARARARRAYWLGGGGVNEPTPGKPKYEKEDSDSIRDKEDKQMVGEPLETGSEGLHPGDEGKTWETRSLGGGKKAAELEERRIRRRAYWQGGGGLNEPAPGKEKYPKEDSDSIRDKEDKQMVGEPLDTGRDGMHPGDEPIKKKWLRARLRAKFTKVADDQGNPIKEASRWDVYAGDKLILTASGSEIYEDELDKNWDFLRSPEYGKALLRHIRNDGFEHTAYLLKGAQPPATPAAAPAAPAAPAVEGDLAGLDLGGLGEETAPPAEEAEGESVDVKQEKGETQQKVDAALNTMEEKIAEVRDLVSGMESDELVDIDINIDDEKNDKEPAAPAAAPEAPMEGVLASREDILKVEALMDLSADELAEASETLDGLDDVPSRVLDAVNDALSDSENILAKAELILKSAKKDDKKDKKDKKEDKDGKDEKKGGCPECDGKLVFGKCYNEKCKKCAKKKDDDKDDKKKKEAQKLLDDALRLRAENRAALLSSAMGMVGETCEQCAQDLEMCACDMMALDPELESDLAEVGVEELLRGAPAMDAMYAKDKDDKKDEKKDDKKDKKDEKEDKKDDEEDKKDKDDKDDKDDEDNAMYVDESPEMVLAARKSERDQLIAQAADILGKYELGLDKAQNATEKTYFAAHPGGKGTVTELSHTKTPEAKVETISEIHDVMRDVAESGPRNVREAAMELQEGIVKGALKVEDIDRLVAEGKVDSAAASYWKKFWGMGTDTGSFGADMSKEFVSKKKEASDNVYRAKLRRAYDIGLEAQDKGLISCARDSLDTYVDELMNFDDASFESTRRVVSSYSADKRASGSVPRVGMDAATEAMNVTASADPKPEVGQGDLLASLGWK